MDKSRNWLITWTRKFRDEHLVKVAKVFLKLKISPNLMTFFSLIVGLAAAYFLFTNYIVFLILGLLHLFLDGMDGVMARVSGRETQFGKYFDLLSDRAVNLAMLVKIAMFLQDYYVILVIAIFLITQSLYFLSKLTFPIVFSRTFNVIALMFTILLGNVIVANIAYLVVGVIALYSLIMQFHYFLAKVRMKKEEN